MANGKLAKLLRPLLQTLTERSATSHGIDVETFIRSALSEREKIKDRIIEADLNLPRQLEIQVKNRVLDLHLPMRSIDELNEALRDFGHERIPETPRPFDERTYDLWKPRYYLMRSLGTSGVALGALGELVAVSELPGVIKINTSPQGALTREDRVTFKRNAHLLNESEQKWFQRIRQHQFELDIVFENGASVGEIKFGRKSEYDVFKLDKLEKQAKRIQKLRLLLEKVGIHKSWSFIFVGMKPDENVLTPLRELGFKIIHIRLE
jgi:hypothetical protein